MSTVYDKARFETAHDRFRCTPLELTDADLAQLAVIDPALEEKAIAARRLAQLAIVHANAVPSAVQTKSLDPSSAPTSRLTKHFETFLVDVLGPIFQSYKTKVAALEQEIAALKAAAFLKDAGLWRHGATYALGDVAQFSGSAWVCTKAHTANGPTVDHSCWRLWIKRGKDGKDARA